VRRNATHNPGVVTLAYTTVGGWDRKVHVFPDTLEGPPWDGKRFFRYNIQGPKGKRYEIAHAFDQYYEKWTVSSIGRKGVRLLGELEERPDFIPLLSRSRPPTRPPGAVMAKYKFYVTTPDGKIHSGWNTAEDANDAIRDIKADFPSANVRTRSAWGYEQQHGAPSKEAWLAPGETKAALSPSRVVGETYTKPEWGRGLVEEAHPVYEVPAPQVASTADRRIARELQELIDYNYNMTSEGAAWEWARDNVTESSDLTYAYQDAKAAWEMVTNTVLTGRRPAWVNKRLAARNNPGVVKVPQAWVDETTDWYEAAMKGAEPKTVKVQVPLDTFPYPHLIPTLKKLYGKDTFGLKLQAVGLPPGVGGDTNYPGPGRPIRVRIAPGIKRPRNTIRHELRHAVQHLGDMALRAEAGKTKKDMRGRFGRPMKRTTASLRGRKAQAKAGKTTMTSTEWYLGSPSEFLPHVGDAAAWVIRKLPDAPTNKQIRDQIRKAVKRRAIFQALAPQDRQDAMAALYTEVLHMLPE